MWKIILDEVPDPQAEPGTNGNAVGIASSDYDESLEDEMVARFRMYDDDGEMYYEGIATPDDGEDGFAPLDDFGTPNAGCTEIRYLEGQEWVTR